MNVGYEFLNARDLSTGNHDSVTSDERVSWCQSVNASDDFRFRAMQERIPLNKKAENQ